MTRGLSYTRREIEALADSRSTRARGINTSVRGSYPILLL